MQISYQTKLTWTLLFIFCFLLCVPIIFDITTAPDFSNPSKLIYLQGISISTITTIYSVLESILGILGIFIVQWYCREVFKRKTSDYIRNGTPIPIDSLTANHTSLTNTAPGIVFFTTETRTFSGFFVFFLLVTRYAVEYYKSFNTSFVAIVNHYPPVNISTLPTQALYYPKINKDTFNSGVQVDFTNGKVNTGGLQPTLYFSKRTPAETSIFGLRFEKGTIPLMTMPDLTMPDLNITLALTSPLPAAVVGIKNWTYRIITGARKQDQSVTFTSPLLPFGPLSFTSTQQDSSYIYFNAKDTAKYNLMKSVSNPWTAVSDIPEQIDFTIVQRLPDFPVGGYSNTSLWSTDVFYLADQKSTLQTLLGLYILTGTFFVNRTEFSIRRDTSDITNAILALNQTFLSKEYTDPAMETLYKQAKIAFFQNLVYNFNSSIQSPGSSVPAYTWTQANEFCIQVYFLAFLFQILFFFDELFDKSAFLK